MRGSNCPARKPCVYNGSLTLSDSPLIDSRYLTNREILLHPKMEGLYDRQNA
jgi:hypothetical protein